MRQQLLGALYQHADRSIEWQHFNHAKMRTRANAHAEQVVESFRVAIADTADSTLVTGVQLLQLHIVDRGNLAVAGGNWIAVGIEFRKPECPLHAVFEFVRYVVFETLSFGMDFCEAETQGFTQVKLEQAMMSNDFQGNASARWCQLNTVVAVVNHQLEVI